MALVSALNRALLLFCFFQPVIGAEPNTCADGGSSPTCLDQTTLLQSRIRTDKVQTDPSPQGLKEDVWFNEPVPHPYSIMPPWRPTTWWTTTNPTESRVRDKIAFEATSDNWPGFKEKTNFVVRWTGQVKIEKPGRYTWCVDSSDGSMLAINQVMLVGNDKVHAMRKRCAFSEAHTGFNELDVKYWQGTGPAGCIVTYQGPDTGENPEIIPASRLFLPKDLPKDFKVPTTTTTTTTYKWTSQGTVNSYLGPADGYCKRDGGMQGLGVVDVDEPVEANCAVKCSQSPAGCKSFNVAPGVHKKCHLFHFLAEKGGGEYGWKCYIVDQGGKNGAR